ncbi:MAG: glycosyltransferase [Parcubacteria group bacterium]|jgi:GT2 family glycosyltransferase
MISIIIPTYNNLFFTQLIIGLIQQTTKIEYELIIVDNHSTEDGMQKYFDWLEKSVELNLFSKIKIFKNDENLGVAKAWNIGIKEAFGKYIAVLNNDIVIDNDCLQRMVKILDENENIWCLSPVFTHKAMPDNWHQKAMQIKNDQKQIGNGATGFFFIFRQDCIKKLAQPKQGYFIDEQFDKLWYEDTDLFMRFKNAGHAPQTTTNVLIHHFESKTIELIPDANKYRAENRTKFNEKYKLSSKTDIEPQEHEKTNENAN